MIPPEARDQWCLLMNMDWPNSYSVGVLKAEAHNLTQGANRDGKVSVSKAGKQNIEWLGRDVSLGTNTYIPAVRDVFDTAERDLVWGEKRSISSINAPNTPGVYALFYKDDLVYIGKTAKLRDRLKKHSRTIFDASRIADCDVTYVCLVRDEHLMVAIESYLIKKFAPPWNSTGFGSNAHGKGRDKQRQSVWNATYGRAATK